MITRTHRRAHLLDADNRVGYQRDPDAEVAKDNCHALKLNDSDDELAGLGLRHGPEIVLLHNILPTIVLDHQLELCLRDIERIGKATT